MKDFKFQQFSISQNKAVFRVGTDAVLLGALVICSDLQSVLEVGTGTGIISLMIAQRAPRSRILALDIDENAVKLAEENFRKSPFSSRLAALHRDFKNFETNQSFDLIVCNPPYFEVNDSQKDVLARQRLTLDFENLIHQSSKFLKSDGLLSVIIPASEEELFVKLALDSQLILCRKVNIRGIAKAAVKRVILEFSPSEKVLKEEELIIEKSPRQYSDEYLDLTKDFHVFTKKSD